MNLWIVGLTMGTFLNNNAKGLQMDGMWWFQYDGKPCKQIILTWNDDTNFFLNGVEDIESCTKHIKACSFCWKLKILTWNNHIEEEEWC